MLKLYSYFRSSAAYRVRIALGLKQLPFDLVPVHLLKDGGQQHSSQYLALNPQGLVPALDAGDGQEVLSQSLAIIEYLDETQTGAKLLPADALGRARVRAIAQAIACDIHPLNNLRVLQYLVKDMGLSAAQKDIWYQHWIAQGLHGLEHMLAGSNATGQFCHGDSPTLADCCLVPQIFNAKRLNCPLEAYPTINRIVAHCETLPAFQQAAPSQQPDAE